MASPRAHIHPPSPTPPLPYHRTLISMGVCHARPSNATFMNPHKDETHPDEPVDVHVAMTKDWIPDGRQALPEYWTGGMVGLGRVGWVRLVGWLLSYHRSTHSIMWPYHGKSNAV